MTAETLLYLISDDDITRALRDDVRTGLTGSPKVLPPRWFYDARGSELFEEITRLPEYYPTRAERAILTERATEIAAVTRAKTLVELGSGSSDKTRLLLDALSRIGELGAFVPLDVSASALEQSTVDIATAYPGISVRGVVGDFTRHLSALPAGGKRLVAFLGGTIGNLVPAERAAFLHEVRAELDPGEWLLVGTDLVKSPHVLVPAYDDAAGVTADFNRNVLRVINRELGADFDPDGFQHVAVWDARHEWIEMRLRASRPYRVTVRALDLTVDFADGEELRTEISAKFHPDGVKAELAAAGFTTTHRWTDSYGRFLVTLAQAG
ncbi:L-histidine N(alpha)-methyltransferase [Virgisporangium aurantiacum]|uniref:Histidine N-alpha-methyltransferase n=1 Tax=Virgisporangium aurantiacum TaxID=175570 RepID=A0A8J4E2L3_9ACTN|nr:L-histidine N(alpha)-methyltransferase [Virgisporangium aurantiacum]GIJ59980.1 histidine N-alpha-methyltransferase [Virgisporangium aurantiacum]